MTQAMTAVIGLFDNVNQAQAAVRELRDLGIPAENVGVVAPAAEANVDADVDKNVATLDATKLGATSGIVSGSVLGGLSGLIVGISALVVPGIGPVLAAGPLGTALATTLIGTGVGATTGGVMGALIGLGVSREEAKLYEAGVRRGGVLVAARVTSSQESEARDILNRHGARNIHNDPMLLTSPDSAFDSR